MEMAVLLQHIIELKEGQASLKTDVLSIKSDVKEIKDELNTSGGIKSRLTDIETDRASVKAVAGAAGVLGGFVGWLFHLWFKATA